MEVNTNPCLDLAAPFLSHLIPHMLEDVLRLTVDQHFPPPGSTPSSRSEAASSASRPRSPEDVFSVSRDQAEVELKQALVGVENYRKSKGRGGTVSELAMSRYPADYETNGHNAGFELVFHSAASGMSV